MAVVNHPDAPYRDADGNDVWPECQCDCQECFSERSRDEAVHPGCKYGCGHPDQSQDRLPLTRGEWNTDEQGRTMSGWSVCGTCDGGGCRDCIG